MTQTSSESSHPELPGYRRTCCNCGSALEPHWTFCITCGLKLDTPALEFISHIDFLLSEVNTWPQRNLTNQFLQEKIGTYYRGYRQQIVDRLLQKAPPKAEAVSQPSPGTDQTPTPVAPPIAQQGPAIPGSPGRAEQFAAKLSEPPPFQTSPEPPKATFSVPPRPLPQPEPVPEVSLLERLSDPQMLRWMVYSGAMMFVIGTIIYLRDVISLQLQRPVVQAGLLALLTMATFGAGVWLLRRTQEELAGRGLLLLGSLLVPANPWFLVHSGLIARGNRAWMVGLVCAVLYAITAMVLRETLMLYLAIPALLASVYGFLGAVVHAPPDVYAAVTVLFAGGLLVLEQKLPQLESDQEFAREVQKPFFLSGHLILAAGLFVYTGLFRWLPFEVLAALQSVAGNLVGTISHPAVIGVTLVGAALYGMTAYTRQNSAWSYLSTGLLLTVAVNELIWFHAPFVITLLTFALCALGLLLASRTEVIFSSNHRLRVLTEPNHQAAWVLAVLTTVSPLFPILHAFFTEDFSLVQDWFRTPLDALWFALTALVLTTFFAIGTRWASQSEALLGIGILFGTSTTFLMSLSGLAALRMAWPGVVTMPGLVVMLLALPTAGLFMVPRCGRWLIEPDLEAWEDRLEMATDWLRGSLCVWECLFAFKALLIADHLIWDQPFYGSIAFLLMAAWIAGWVMTAQTRLIQSWIGLGIGVALTGSFCTAVIGVQNRLHFSNDLRTAVWMLAGFGLAGCAIRFHRESQLEENKERHPLSPVHYVTELTWVAQFVVLGSAVLVGYAMLSSPRMAAIGLGAELAALALVASQMVKTEVELGWLCLTAWMSLLGSWWHTVSFLKFPDGWSYLPQTIIWATAGYVLLWAALDRFRKATEQEVLVANGLPEYQTKAARQRIIGQTLWAVSYVVLAAGLEMLAYTWPNLSHPFYLVWPSVLLTMELAGLLLICGHWIRQKHLGIVHLIGGMGLIAFGYAAFIDYLPLKDPRWEMPLIALWLLVQHGFARIAVSQSWTQDERWAKAARLTNDLCAFPVLVINFFILPMAVVESFPAKETQLLTFTLITVIWAGWVLASQTTWYHKIGLGVSLASTWAVVLNSLGIKPAYFPAAYLFLGFLLLVLSLQLLPRLNRNREASHFLANPLEHIGHFISLVSLAGLVGQALVWLPDIRRDEQYLLVALMLGLLSTTLISTITRGTTWRKFYAPASYLLGGLFYVRMGLFLGYGLFRDIEVFSLPIGAALLLVGYLGLRRSDENEQLNLFCIWQGSLLLCGPMFLHALHLRFVAQQSSLWIDIGLDTVALGMIVVGILLQLRAPVLLGLATAIFHLTVVMLHSVPWGQIHYAVYLAVVGAVLFGSGWAISRKRRELEELQANLQEQFENSRRALSGWR